MAPERTRILIAGGGYAGMYTALRLQKTGRGCFRFDALAPVELAESP